MDKRTKVCWLSRHEMTEGQMDDLCKTLGINGGHLFVVNINHTWEATADQTEDKRRNAEFLKATFSRGDVVAGVFPPVAIEALNEVRKDFYDFTDVAIKATPVYTPVSAQSPTLRADGTRQIEFRHVRWAKI